MAVTQVNRNVAINTPLGEDKVLIVSASISEQMGRMFRMDVDLSSDNSGLDFSSVVGGNATIRLTLANSKTPRYFNGFVSRFMQTDADQTGGRYRLTMVPWLWFLTRTADCRIFQNMTVPDIIKKVFRDHGFTDFKDALSGTYKPWEYCVQYRETDFNFVSRLMEHEGIYYFFEHDNGKHTLVLSDAISAHNPFPNYDTVSYRSGKAGLRDEETIDNWTLEQEVQPGSYSLNDFNFEKPKTSLVARSDILASHAQSSFEMYDYPGEYREQSDGSDYSKVRIEELHSQHEVVQGHSNARGLAAGYTFTLKDAPRRDQNRKYLITSASYQLTADDYQSGSKGGDSEFYACSFTAIDATKPFRAARATPKPLIQGPQTAIVVGPKDEEIYTDKYGRVKVQFHWDRYGKFDENSSCWVRISQAAWAGKKWGSIHIPRVGQEVIVEFLEGDPDRPIITGRVYNADCMPPYDLPAEKTKSTIKSNSSKGSKGFNELRFEDKKGGEQIFIHGQHNMDVRVRNDLKETNYGNRHERIGWKSDEGSGGSHFITVQQDENTHVTQKHYEMADDEGHLRIKGEVVERLDKSFKAKVAENFEINTQQVILQAGTGIALSTKSLLAKGSDKVHLSGNDIVLEGHSICLSVGGSFVSIGAGGVDIQGTAVNINSGGSSKSATAPQEMSDFSVMEPLDASVASDATGGTMGHYSGAPAVRGGGPVGIITVPPFVPLPKTPAPVTPGTGSGLVAGGGINPTATICGGPYTFTDAEGRKCNNSLTLEVVPNTVFSGDTITVKSDKGCSCAGALVNLGGTNGHLNQPIKVDGWDSGDSLLAALELLFRVTPHDVPMTLTCGKDQSSIGGGTVRVYPSTQISFKLDLNALYEKVPFIKEMFDELAKMLTSLTGKNVSPTSGLSFYAGPVFIKIGAPVFSIDAQAAWKENAKGTADEWETHLSWKLGISFTLSVEFKLDLLAVLGDATSEIGIGEGIIALDEILKKYVEADEAPPLYLSFKFEITDNGSIGVGDNGFAFGSLSATGTGTLSIGAGASKGGGGANGDDIIVEMSAEAATAISGTVEGKVSTGGVGAGKGAGAQIQFALPTWSGVTGKASVKISIGKVLSVGFDKSVQFMQGKGPLWTPTFSLPH